jgi:lipopolysaccharide transport system permease protein
METQAESGVDTVIIRGGAPSWSPQLRNLWQRRELLYFLTWRDIKVRYKQTSLGLAWTVMQPLALAATLTVFLGRFARVPSEGLPYFIFAYSAMIVWQLFANALTESSNSLLANERLISKVYFPRLIVPVSAVMASLLDFAISLFVLVPFLVYYRIAPAIMLVAFPLVVFLAVLSALGAGLWLAALNVKYRDVRYTVAFLVQFWFLATPVAYPASLVPKRWQVWYSLNPMVGVVEGFRWSLGGTANVSWLMILNSGCVAVVIFVSGLYYFLRTEDTFADFI